MSIVYHAVMNDYREVLKLIGYRLRIERIKQNLSQEKFAELANVHTNYIGKVERGEQNITIKKLVDLANSINVSVNKLL